MIMTMDQLAAIKPAVTIDVDRKNPGNETMGESLSSVDFPDIYEKVIEEGQTYFYRVDGKGDISFYVIFDSIDDFSQSTESQVYLDFQMYKTQFITVVWTVSDPQNPLGFPVKFDVHKEEDLFAVIQFLQQSETWIHYLAAGEMQEDGAGDLIHIYSEAITFSAEDKNHGAEMIFHCREWTPELEEEDGEDADPTIISAAEIIDDRLRESGTQYLLDYSELIMRAGDEETAKMKAMGALSRILLFFKRHPSSILRDTSFLTWVGEREGENRNGEKTRILSIAVTPALHDLFPEDNRGNLGENPFAMFYFSFAEFLRTEESQPLHDGAFPIAKYEAEEIYHIEVDETALEKLFAAHRDTFGSTDEENPYRMG